MISASALSNGSAVEAPTMAPPLRATTSVLSGRSTYLRKYLRS
jgi:hypothetical protein